MKPCLHYLPLSCLPFFPLCSLGSSPPTPHVVEVFARPEPAHMDSSVTPPPPHKYCGLERRALKFCAIFFSLGSLVLINISISRSVCNGHCVVGTFFGFLVAALIAIGLCSGLCVVLPSNQEELFCGCNHKEHGYMTVTGFVVACIIFALLYFVAWRWYAAMFVSMLFFLFVSCIGKVGFQNTTQAAPTVPTISTVTSSVREEDL